IAKIRRLSDVGTAFTIETIPRVGYRLNETPSTTSASNDNGELTSVPVHVRRRTHAIATSSIIFLCLCAGAYWIWQHHKSLSQNDTVQTVAVLPFVSRNTDPDSQNFADSISATVAATLNRAGLPVISTATTFKYRDDARSRIGKELKARYVIDGEVRRDNGLVHVVVRIDDGRNGNTLLANSFDADSATASKLSTRVADHIASYAWAFRSRQLANANTDVTAVFYHSMSRHLNGDNMAAYLEARTLAKKYPDDVVAQSLFAFVTSFAYWQIPQQDLEMALLEARRANQQTHVLDAGYGDAYVATGSLLPFHH
ncbi:MAG: hypothetical protein JF604_25725, partial [Bradyrhizobium sp.]|nr:hypothetical protein [Bradyrhizobium sp.]